MEEDTLSSSIEPITDKLIDSEDVIDLIPDESISPPASQQQYPPHQHQLDGSLSLPVDPRTPDSTPADTPQPESNEPKLSYAAVAASATAPAVSSENKSTNPFKENLSRTIVASPDIGLSKRTKILNSELIKYPFKTLNRILNDLKWTIPVRQKYNYSLLNSKPIDYSRHLSHIVNSNVFRYKLLELNENLPECPTLETIKLEETSQTLFLLRGLLVDEVNDSVFHYRILVLESDSNPFIINIIDKHQYHIISPNLLSPNDLQILRRSDESVNIIDDGFFKSLNSSNNQILRVTIFDREFTHEDLNPLLDNKIIRQRYMKGIEKHPNLSPEVTPSSKHCIKTLTKVLRGPILLKPQDPIKTISLKNTVMDAQIDVNLLLSKLSFTLDEEKQDVIPPNLTLLPGLKESYIRKVLELLYLQTKIKPRNDESVTVNPFVDTLPSVFQTIAEYDKGASIQNFNNTHANRFPYLVNLSVSPHFSDELIIKCFENTKASDMANRLHYVDSLRNTRDYKHNINTTATKKIDAYLKNMANQGELIGFSDYLQSMKILGLTIENEEEIDQIDDDVIIAMYRTQFKNDAKNYPYYNKNLNIIARAKQSRTLLEFISSEIIPMNIALGELNIEEITEDDVVITAYEFKLDDILQLNGFNANSDDVVFLNKALVSVAVQRKSYILLNYLETKLPAYVKLLEMEEISSAKAYDLLDCKFSMSDFEILTNFQNKFVNSELDIRILRYCMSLVAESRKSDIIYSFLKSGKIDSSLLPAENWPAGLDNIGNTCYLNSLLQYYFCIKPLRELILSYDESNFSIDEFSHMRKIGGRKVEISELNRSTQFVYHLRYLFDEMIKTNNRCVQPSKELAYLSFLPSSQPVNFKEEQNEVEVVMKEVDGDESEMTQTESGDLIIDCEGKVEILDSEQEQEQEQEDLNVSSMEVENESEVVKSGPKILSISTDQMESTIEVGRQQDVTECIENVIFQIETVLPPHEMDKDGEQYDLIKKLFYGKTKQTITSLDKPEEKPRVSLERFFSLIINVSDHPKSIYDALDYYFNEDVVKLDEGLFKRSITINELPEILQFHVQRVMFDREKLMAYKSIEPIPFSETVYLDRYLDTQDPEILSKREEVFKWKREISELMEIKKNILHVDQDTSMSIIDTLTTTKKYLESRIIQDDKLSVELTTIQVIQQEIYSLKEKLVDIDSKLEKLHIQVSGQFENYRSIGYSIFAIFIHRGEASYGHYWVYIKDPHNNNIFRKYNDEMVTEVPASEVFNFVEGNTATPYYIVYVKDELEYEYIEPLKREIEAN
ncbi:Ubiquitin carboxyl-terminal hydrolase 2 [Spathaspora sp. JA1]|nr:Ubiquitin carboxyl-terminal hydrolase 2 [Spathaspora sp. JA1]